MKGWYNNTCRVEDLMIHKYKDTFIDSHLLKFVVHKENFRPILEYPASKEGSDAFKMEYPEGGQDIGWPDILHLVNNRYADFYEKELHIGNLK